MRRLINALTQYTQRGDYGCGIGSSNTEVCKKLLCFANIT